jgi:hypothetical protein
LTVEKQLDQSNLVIMTFPDISHQTCRIVKFENVLCNDLIWSARTSCLQGDKLEAASKLSAFPAKKKNQ